ncbi:MAG: tetratricopeptide repeat protein [Pseudomonadota bacterium]
MSQFRWRAIGMLFLSLCLLGGCEEVRARRCIQEGTKAFQAGSYEQAIAAFEEGLKIRPDLKIGWFNLAVAHLALFSPGAKTEASDQAALGAIRAFKEYLVREPGDSDARRYLVSTYIDSGHYEGALQHYEEKLARNPEDINAIAQLADINEKAGRLDDANRWHRRRIESETSNDGKADCWYRIGMANWRRLNRKELPARDRLKIADEGLAALQQADLLRPNHRFTIIFMNLLYRERGLAHSAEIARAVDFITAEVLSRRAQALASAERQASNGTAAGTAKADPAKTQTTGQTSGQTSGR